MRREVYKLLLVVVLCSVMGLSATACGKKESPVTSKSEQDNIRTDQNLELEEDENKIIIDGLTANELHEIYADVSARTEKRKELREQFQNVTPNEGEIISSIAFYSKDKLLMESRSELHIGQDLISHAITNALTTEVGALLYYFPGPGIRAFDDGRKYIIYETDGGNRVFVFYNSENDYIAPYGRALILSEVRSYSDFAGITAGSTMSELEAIDPVTSYYREKWTDRFKLIDLNFKNQNYAILYYLEEGILEVQFDGIDENGDYRVGNVELHGDYKIDSIAYWAESDEVYEKVTVNYQIDELDLIR